MHADQVRLKHDIDEEMFSEPESNEGESIMSRQDKRDSEVI